MCVYIFQLEEKMIEKLAYSLGRNDEEPNIDLALELIKTKNKKGVKKIVEGLSNKTEQIANDCIKVLYEIGEREPVLISEYCEVFIKLLNSRNNRLVWGAMMALAEITSINTKKVFDNLDMIVNAYRKGSVITVDNSITVFAKLAKAGSQYEKAVFPILITHLETCRPKEVGQHSERAFVCVSKNNSDLFKKTILARRASLTEPQKKRVDKLLKRIEEGKYGC
jgi:hypothetical protein